MDYQPDYEFDIFISYRHEPFGYWINQHFLPPFRDYLKQSVPLGRDAQIFIDREGISTGDNWPDRLKYALAHSRCMVAIWHRDYFESKWCLAELNVMWHRRLQFPNPPKIILPISVHDGQLFPQEVTPLQYKSFNDFALPGKPSKTPKYVTLQRTIQQWVENDVVKAIDEAPAWSEAMRSKEWLEKPIQRMLIKPTPRNFKSPPSLAGQ